MPDHHVNGGFGEPKQESPDSGQATIFFPKCLLLVLLLNCSPRRHKIDSNNHTEKRGEGFSMANVSRISGWGSRGQDIAVHAHSLPFSDRVEEPTERCLFLVRKTRLKLVGHNHFRRVPSRCQRSATELDQMGHLGCEFAVGNVKPRTFQDGRLKRGGVPDTPLLSQLSLLRARWKVGDLRDDRF